MTTSGEGELAAQIDVNGLDEPADSQELPNLLAPLVDSEDACFQQLLQELQSPQADSAYEASHEP